MNHSDPVTAIITGASSGIGEAVALALARRSARLTLTGRRMELLNELARKVHRAGGTAFVVQADLREEEQLRALFASSWDKWGRLDILINSAGYGSVTTLHDGPTDAWKTMLAVNVFALALAMHEALAQFDTARGGHIVNISSTSAHRVPPGGGFYAATKFAVRALTDALRQELAARDSRTRVSSISPGRVATDFFDSGNSRLRDTAVTDATLLLPEDVAMAVLQVLDAPSHVVVDDIVLRARMQRT